MLNPLTAPNSLALSNPALSGGISLSPSNLPTLNAADPAMLALPSAERAAAVSPAAKAPSARSNVAAVSPAARFTAPSIANPADRSRRAPATTLAPSAERAALGSAREFAGEIREEKRGGLGKALSSIFGRFFDGSGKRAALNAADDVPAAGRYSAMASRHSLGDVTFHALDDGSDIRTNLPRTVVVGDSFIGAAPETTVARLQTLIDQGVHVVVLSDRPDRGEGSIDEILVSKLKPGMNNPIAIVSYSGARISFKETASRWSVSSEAGAFEESDVDRLAGAAARASASAKLKNVPSYTLSPDNGSALTATYFLEGTDARGNVDLKRRGFIRAFNRSMASAKQPYRMQAHPTDPLATVVHAMNPRTAVGRLGDALAERFPDQDLASKGNETVLLMDAKEREALMRSITASPDSVHGVFKNATVLHAKDAGEQAILLGDITRPGDRQPVQVSMGDMRQYLDFWRPVMGRSGNSVKNKGNSSAGRFGLFTWQVLHELVTDLYVETARSGTRYRNFGRFRDELRRRWSGKARDGKFERYRRSKGGKVANAEYLRHAETWAENFWAREVGRDYQTFKKDVQQNLVTEGKVYMRVPLRSPFTGRSYSLGVSVDRVMTMDSAEGRELNATVYRFGKENVTDGDEAQARAVALAVLRGYGAKGLDLKWHHGSEDGKPLARITVTIEYMKRARVFDFSPDELLRVEADGTISQGPKALELVNEIESAQADYKFQNTLDKKSRVAPNQDWEGTQWEQSGRPLQELFASVHPDAPKSDRLRPFISEAEALRPKTEEKTPRIEILKSRIDWPSNAKVPDMIDENGTQIQDDLEAMPRVVFIQDVFTEPASDATVDYIQRLVNAGAHVVFMTARPHKGEDSADTVLLSRLKVSQNNPIIVASHNGGRIALHSRAKDPKAYIPDSRAFNEETLKAFNAVASELAGDLDVEFEFEELPNNKSAFQYNLWIPKSVPANELAAVRSKAIRGFNAAMRQQGLEYSIERHPDNPRLLWARSQPMRLSLDRVFSALDKRFHGEELLTRPETFLVIGDSKRSRKLSKAWPKQVTFRSAKSEEELFDYVGSVLGDRRQKMVGVKLGEIRTYTDFWEPMLERRSGNFGSDGHQSHRGTEEDRRYHGPMAMFTGSILYKLMPELFENVWRGQTRNASKNHAKERLRQMWRNPEKEGVFVSKRQAAVMNEPGWKERSRGYLERALTLFDKIYERTFEHYGATAKDIMHNMAALATDRQSLITLVFKSGGKIYKVFTRLPRLMKHDTSEGRVLSVVTYRSGKEPAKGKAADTYTKTLAMAILAGFAQPGADGFWHDGWAQGPKISKLHVRVEYKQSGRDFYFDPSDFFKIMPNGSYKQGVVVKEIANMIERMRADDEFQEHYKAETEEATEEEIKAAKKRGTSSRLKKGGN
jgi:hypothetical protein